MRFARPAGGNRPNVYAVAPETAFASGDGVFSQARGRRERYTRAGAEQPA
jgi:hypothetical protein